MKLFPISAIFFALMAITLSQLEDRDHELNQLLLSREEKFVHCSRALSLFTTPLCCCFVLRNFKPSKKAHFVCTVLDPCLCCYEAATYKEKYLLPPERQEMEDLSKKIVAIVAENRKRSFMEQTHSVATTETSLSRRASSSLSESIPTILQTRDLDWEDFGGRCLSVEPVFKQTHRPILEFMQKLNNALTSRSSGICTSVSL